ncbi:MAG: hypothetical protein ABIK65_06800 [Candidatus Eisenbacteria bacterium]
MKEAELAAHVQAFMSEEGIEVVLSGGACVCIYSAGKYVSSDIDLVDIGHTAFRRLMAIMGKNGFQAEGRHFTHPDSEYLVEFPPGPLAVGSEPVGRVDEIETAAGGLRIISPTDCVKDRLAAYYHWNDLQCLEQALLVTASREIDFAEVERWSGAEGMGAKFERIRKGLTGR